MLVITDLSGNSEIVNKFNNFEMYAELNGAFTLTFTSYRHVDNPGHDLIIHEGLVEYDGYTFRIKQLRKQINTIQVACISTFYDNVDIYKYDIYGGTHTLNEFLTYTFAGTSWTWTCTGTIDVGLSKLIPNFGETNVIQLIEILKVIFELEVGIDRDNHITISDKLGPDTDYQYRYGRNIMSLTESVDTTKLKTYIEGFGATGIHVTYTSPYASNPGIGIRHAEPIHDTSYTDADALLAYLKTQLHDHPDSVVELDDNILLDRTLGERVWLIHERMGFEYQTRVVSRRIKIPNSLSSVTLGTYSPQSRSIGDELASQRVTIDKNNTVNKSRIDQTNEKIELEVTRLDGKDVELQANITIEADRITTEVTSREEGDTDSRSYTEQTATEIISTVSTEVTRLDGRVDVSDSLISQNAGEILLRVREDGVISAINLTPEEVRIAASRINLEGSVTFTDLNPGVNSKFTKIDSDGIYTGSINATQIIAQNGYIAKLTVDEIETSDKIQRYIAHDINDVNYIRAKDQYIEWVTASTDGAVDPDPVEDRDGNSLYWFSEADIGVRVTTDITDWPITIYLYTEHVKRRIGFETVGAEYIPVDIIGAGSGVGDNAKGFIRKGTDGMEIEYISNSGASRKITLGDDGIMITPFDAEEFEFKSIAWNSSGVTFTMANGYSNKPIVTTSVEGNPLDFASASYALIVEYIKETVGGVANTYSKIKITPKGSSVPTPTGAFINIHAVCSGKIERS